MKTLFLLRHAKSGWDDPVARDFDRPLNLRGQRAAVAMGKHMKSLGLGFDAVIASPAVRVIETLDLIGSGYGGDLAPAWDKRIYLTSAATLLDLVQDLPDAAGTAMMVGHSPGIEELVLWLVPGGALRHQVAVKFPTGALAEIVFEADRWQDVAPGDGELIRFIRPRDLDSSLGPDGS
jgi:phosphohistidine phosphatase